MPFVERGEHRIHYEIIELTEPWLAERATLLFHHGIGAESGVWTDWIHALAERYRIVRFDMRGYGRSDVPAADFPWSIAIWLPPIPVGSGAWEASISTIWRRRGVRSRRP